MKRWPILGLIAILIVTACGWWLSRPAAVPVERVPSGAGPASYVAALAGANRAVESASALERGRAGEWLFEERLANALIARASLTGSFDDYRLAQAALDRAFATAPAGAGPHQTQAALAFAMHRLGQTAAVLDAIDHYAVADADTRIEVAATRGDIAFYRGDYALAERLYTSASSDPGDPAVLFRLANLKARTGRPGEAIATLDRCESEARLPSAHYLADLALRRGTIELRRGRWEEAGRHFDRAARLFPGWWLAEAHKAQMLALAGKTNEAIAAFEKLARTANNPEAMDALASLYRQKGDRGRSAFWADQAGGIWNDRLRALPEASYGHAVEHLLAFGDPQSALDLARKDAANRPYGQSSIALGWALIANNDPRGALAVIGPVIASTWVSAEAHLAAAQAHLLLGENDAADVEQQTALTIDPQAMNPSSTLVWFGH